MAVRFGETKLIDAINQTIEEMRADKLQSFLKAATAEFYQTKQDQSAPLDLRAVSVGLRHLKSQMRRALPAHRTWSATRASFPASPAGRPRAAACPSVAG